MVHPATRIKKLVKHLDATSEELRAEMERRLNALQAAGIIELKPLPAPGVQ
jgi:hypothetical protein